jgi:O-antigen ligase
MLALTDKYKSISLKSVRTSIVLGASVGVVYGVVSSILAPHAGIREFLVAGHFIMRAQGFFTSPNLFGLYAATAYFLAADFPRRKMRILLQGLFVVGILASLSRGAMLAFAIGLILQQLFIRRSGRARRVALLLFGSGLGALLADQIPLFGRAVTRLLHTFGGAGVGVAASDSARWTMWTAAIRGWAAAPLTGHGLDSFRLTYAWYLTSAQALQVGHPTHAHDLLLQIGTELGLLGVLTVVGVFGAHFISAIRTRYSNPSYLAVLGSIAAWSLFDYPLQGGPVEFLLVVILAMAWSSGHEQTTGTVCK